MKKLKDGNNFGVSLARFVAGWAATFLIAMVASMGAYSLVMRLPEWRGSYNLLADAHWLFVGAGLATLQFLWLRRSLGISLRGWIPLAVLGLILGEIAFQVFEAYVQRPFPPKLYSGSSQPLPEPEHIMQLKYALYHTATNFLRWSTPLIFQWVLLRKRFQQHWLWLIAALAYAPLSFGVGEYGGILTQGLKLLSKLAILPPAQDLQPLISYLFIIDWALPTAVMGLVLYWMAARGEKDQAVGKRAI